MLRMTLWHEPEGFQFFLRDPDERALRYSSQLIVDEMRAKGFSVRHGGVAVRTISEFSTVPVQVEYDVDGFPELAGDWDHVIECSLETSSGRFVFEGCTDPEPFGVLDLPNGSYRVRIHFGGQQSGKADGSSEDFYLFRIWPGHAGTRILKGDESWPRPMQPWESANRGKASGSGVREFPTRASGKYPWKG